MAKILIMEDDLDFAGLLSDSLVDAGHEIFWFPDATTALWHLQQHRVDLVVTDLSVKKDGQSIPDGGIKLISKLRRLKRPGVQTVPVIAITGTHIYHGMGDALKIAKQVGANASLEKPFGPDVLLLEIDRWLP